MVTNPNQSHLTPYSAPPRLAEWIALAAILILAAILRLGAPGVVEFKTDEANLSERALDLVRGRDLPLLGIDSSVGVPNSPVSIYILAIPFAISSNPLVAPQFIGLLNVIAVGLLYAIARRYYRPLAAIVAGLLFAISPSGGTTTGAIRFSYTSLRDAAFVVAGTQIDQIITPQGDPAFIASLLKILPLLNVLTLIVVIGAGLLVLRAVRCQDARTPIDV